MIGPDEEEIPDEPTRREKPPLELIEECTPTRVTFMPREKEWFREST